MHGNGVVFLTMLAPVWIVFLVVNMIVLYECCPFFVKNTSLEWSFDYVLVQNTNMNRVFIVFFWRVFWSPLPQKDMSNFEKKKKIAMPMYQQHNIISNASLFLA